MNENSINCIFVIDESGSLGYSKNQEKFEGEFGLVAGYFLPFSTVQKANKAAKHFFAEFRKKDDEKIHITDLSPEEQSKLRNKVFEIFKCNNFIWLYDAISVQGMHEFYKDDDCDEKDKNNIYRKKEKIHTKLFCSIILKALAVIKMDNKAAKKINMSVVSDRLNPREIKDIEQEFKNHYHYLLTTGQKEEIRKNFKYKTTVTGLDDFQFDELNININTNISDVTLVADVLANSAFHYLTQKIKENPDIDLNSKEAIKQHPLAHRVWGNQIESILDIMYRRGR